MSAAAAQARATLELRCATVGYGDRAVVAHADLSMAPGTILGLVGPNGAGKTTLLRAVTGQARVLSGSVLLAGRDVAAMTATERARLVGVLPQSPAPAFSFSAREYVLMGRHARMSRFAGPAERDTAVADDVMMLTDTARFADSPADQLSGGDLQRLTLAQALAQEPAVLLLDEPTSHLDLDHTLQVLDLVRGLADDGMTVLGVFHDLDLAARYADRIAVVADGRIVRCGTPREVLDSELLAEVFHVKAVVGTDPLTGAPSVTPVARDASLPPATRGRVLVVCGSGTGAWLLRRLRLAGFDVAGGALNRGDTDEAVARALDLPFVGLPPFGTVDAAAEESVAALARKARWVVVCDTPFGGANLGNLRGALGAAADRVVFVGGDAAGRDFTGGCAMALVEDALALGASAVADDQEALELVERMLP
jgi:iron complex transport system ATP-binding protein